MEDERRKKKVCEIVFIVLLKTVIPFSVCAAVFLQSVRGTDSMTRFAFNGRHS